MDKSKSFFVCLVSAALTGLTASQVLAHDNQKRTVQVAIGTAGVSISYAAPTLKGRDPMKMIQPGDLWRMGADFPTTLESDSDLDFGGKRVPKGKYVLLAHLVEPGKWTLIVSTKDRNHYDASAKVAEIPLELQHRTRPAEELAIELTEMGNQAVIQISWGTLGLKGSFAAATVCGS